MLAHRWDDVIAALYVGDETAKVPTG